MALAALTDKVAVECAIAEFDTLGRAAFLAKYGFGPARSYFVLFRGGRYDSKAIAGAAHGYQHPDQGPLVSAGFRGGETTVAEKLRPPVTWAFCANPKRYRVSEAVRHLELDYWAVERSDVRAGDRAAIWQTRDSRGNRGVVAFAHVLGDPEPRTDEDNPFWTNSADGQERCYRVPVSYVVPKRLPLWAGDTEVGAFLKSLSVARSQGGSLFKVTAEQWSHLTELASYPEVSIVEIEVREQLRHRTSARGGQGFGLSSSERKAVEEHAMGIALRHLELEWDVVTDVSRHRSYDLLCQRASEELRVEVKGTASAGRQVVLTRNEVEAAQEPGYALFIVSQIDLDRSAPHAPVASGGTARLFSPWTPPEGALQPLVYACDIDNDDGVAVSVHPGREEV